MKRLCLRGWQSLDSVVSLLRETEGGRSKPDGQLRRSAGISVSTRVRLDEDVTGAALKDTLLTIDLPDTLSLREILSMEYAAFPSIPNAFLGHPHKLRSGCRQLERDLGE